MSPKSLLTVGNFLVIHKADPGSNLQNSRIMYEYIFPTGLTDLGGYRPEASDGVKCEKDGEKEQ